MREELRPRVMRAAELILGAGATVRGCAAELGVSKTTVHKDLRERLQGMDEALAERVDAALRRNLRERHIRGGEATKRSAAARRASKAASKRDPPQSPS